MRRFLEKLNTPRAVIVVLVLTLMVNGLLAYYGPLGGQAPTNTSAPALSGPGLALSSSGDAVPAADTAGADSGGSSNPILAPQNALPLLSRTASAQKVSAPSPTYREDVYENRGAAVPSRVTPSVVSSAPLPTPAPVYPSESSNYQQPATAAPTGPEPAYRSDSVQSSYESTPGGTAAQEDTQSTTTTPDGVRSEETSESITKEGAKGPVP
jgi:hypothetical protein